MKRNKIWDVIGMFSLCMGMSAGLLSCNDETVSPALDEKVLISGINIGVTPELPLLIHTDSLMTWEVFPEDATNKNVIWTSASPEIASVSEDGRISAHAVGTRCHYGFSGVGICNNGFCYGRGCRPFCVYR